MILNVGELPTVFKREFIGTVLDIEDTVLNKINKNLCPAGFVLGVNLKT